jgi:ribulose-5-phosphate 4-epimerase/fuculose-1-phosphate aldolase
MDEKEFVINFFGDISKEITLEELTLALQGIERDVLEIAVENIKRVLATGQTNISRRELFLSLEQGLGDEVLERLDKAGLVVKFEGLPPAGSVKTVYKGKLFPDGLSLDEIRVLEKEFIELQTAAKRLAREVPSSPKSHIVLGARLILAGGAYLLISATDTPKDACRVLADSPLLKPEGNAWALYGDPGVQPTSETAAFWHMFESLRESGSGGLDHVVHAHAASIIAAARGREIIEAGASSIPVVKPEQDTYGSSALGKRMADAILAHSAKGVCIDEHGPFMVAESFAEAAENLVQISFKLKVKG